MANTTQKLRVRDGLLIAPADYKLLNIEDKMKGIASVVTTWDETTKDNLKHYIFFDIPGKYYDYSEQEFFEAVEVAITVKYPEDIVTVTGVFRIQTLEEYKASFPYSDEPPVAWIESRGRRHE